MNRMFRLALIQMNVVSNLEENLKTASLRIAKAVEYSKADVVCLPECFNSPYGTQHFEAYAECIPSGTTCQTLSSLAKQHKIYLVAGSIPEKDALDSTKLYNTCTVWNGNGEMIAKHRKIHLFDIDIPGKITFKESDVLSPGNKFTTFETESRVKFGLGICYDIRFADMAKYYARKEECHVLIYPGAFNMTTGPLHWHLLARCRALDNQLFVACPSPARSSDAESDVYVSYANSLIIDPWGEIIGGGDSHTDDIITADIDLNKIKEVRQQIPISKQMRSDLY